MKKMRRFLYLLIFIAAANGVCSAQVAAGGSFRLEQSVIASGGGASTDGGTQFSLIGSIGQPAAGTVSTNNPYSVRGGFFTSAPLAPTAAEISISGRILTPGGQGLVNAVVMLTLSGGQIRSIRSTTFGYYRFENVLAGQPAVLSVSSKRFQFAPQILSLSDSLTDFDLVAISPD